MNTMKNVDRLDLLADVAEMYYQEGKTQAEISEIFNITRSAISRILTEARQKGIVEIHIRRPLRFEADLEQALIERFSLKNACVVTWQSDNRYEALKIRLGIAAARIMSDLINSCQTIGVAWGTTVGATIEACETAIREDLQIVQLVGALGSAKHAYSGQTLVEKLARKVGGKGIYLYTPFIVETAKTARALANTPGIHEALDAGRKCDAALIGIGSTRPEYCSLVLGGHISIDTLTALRKIGAVGDVSGHYFDIYGNTANTDYHQHMVGLSIEVFLKIPTRLAVAGNPAKAEAIYAALVGGYANILVSDSQTVTKVLELADVYK